MSITIIESRLHKEYSSLVSIKQAEKTIELIFTKTSLIWIYSTKIDKTYYGKVILIFKLLIIKEGMCTICKLVQYTTINN
jgi:hypothetical protein